MPSDSPLIRFGVIADPQYAPLPPNPALNRHFEKSLGKLDEAIGVFNAHDLAFVVTLGDLVDRGYENFDAVLARYERLTHESILLPGNHDFLVAPEQLPEVHRRLSMPAPYHHFSRNGLRFVVIDGSEESLFAAPEGDPRRARAETRLAAPAPLAMISGETPRINDRAVIITARKRNRAASRAAFLVSNPASRRTLANSTIRIALLADSPISITMPIWA